MKWVLPMNCESHLKKTASLVPLKMVQNLSAVTAAIAWAFSMGLSTPFQSSR